MTFSVSALFPFSIHSLSSVFCLASILIPGLPFYHQREFANPVPRDNRTTNPQRVLIKST